MQTQREKRAFPRVPMELDASITAQADTRAVTVANLSMGGALLVNAGDLTVGSGVRLSFMLPSGLPVRINGKVVRRDGKNAYGVQFFELDDVTREILDDHLVRFGTTPGIEARVRVKFNLESRANRLTLTLSGFLEKSDCIELRSQMELVATRLAPATELIIDAVDFVCCAPDGLKDFTAWMSAFASTALIGGLVGPRSVGVLQIRRAIRDAHIADAFMGFESVAEAADTFGRLSATTRPGLA